MDLFLFKAPRASVLQNKQFTVTAGFYAAAFYKILHFGNTLNVSSGYFKRQPVHLAVTEHHKTFFTKKAEAAWQIIKSFLNNPAFPFTHLMPSPLCRSLSGTTPRQRPLPQQRRTLQVR